MPERRPPRMGLSTLASWPARRWLFAALCAVLAALLMGVPTGIVETSFYTRMTPVTWWNYPVWAVSAVLVGLTAASYLRAPGGRDRSARDRAGRTVGATLRVAARVLLHEVEVVLQAPVVGQDLRVQEHGLPARDELGRRARVVHDRL
jgi:hypothetical protein